MFATSPSTQPLDLPEQFWIQPPHAQTDAWAKVIRLYGDTLSKAAENGLTKVKKPNLTICQGLRNKSIHAQHNLLTQTLDLASTVCKIVSQIFKVIAISLAAVIVIRILVLPIAGPLLILQSLTALFSATLSKGLLITSNLLREGAIQFGQTYFTNEELAEIENLKEWKRVTHFIEIEGSVRETQQALAEAVAIDQQYSPIGNRTEWNFYSTTRFTALVDKIEAFNQAKSILNNQRNRENSYLLREMFATK